MQTLTVTWTGIRPLIMSNPQTVDDENPYAQASRRLNIAKKKARKKDDESLIELSRQQKANDFYASAFFDERAKKFFIRDSTILACIRDAAKDARRGKDIERCVMMEETEAWIEGVPAVESLEQAFKMDQFRLETPAKIPPKTGALLWKVRCMMPTGWRIKFSLTFDEEIFPGGTMLKILERAGRFIGLGGWRPKFGRFTCEVE